MTHRGWDDETHWQDDAGAGGPARPHHGDGPGGGASPYGSTNPHFQHEQTHAMPYPPHQPYPYPEQTSAQPYPYQQQQPNAGQPPQHPGYQNTGYPHPGGPGFAPGRFDPFTGEPLSDKSRVLAGVLQFFFGVFGVGRFYIGDSKTGAIQLALGLVGLCTTIILIGVPILMVVGVWSLIDAVLMWAGSVRDSDGRKLN